MKRLLFVYMAFATGLLFSNAVGAQQKVGYFDEKKTLALFPGISKVDTLMQDYRRDSIGAQYDNRQWQYELADSLYKKNCGTATTANSKSCEEALKDVNQKKNILSNWYTLAQRMSEAKMDRLLLPYRQKIYDALHAVVTEQKYAYVLSEQSLSVYSVPPLLDNLNIRVAMKLNLPLPAEVQALWKKALAGPAQKAKPGGAPVKKK